MATCPSFPRIELRFRWHWRGFAEIHGTVFVTPRSGNPYSNKPMGVSVRDLWDAFPILLGREVSDSQMSLLRHFDMTDAKDKPWKKERVYNFIELIDMLGYGEGVHFRWDPRGVHADGTLVLDYVLTLSPGPFGTFDEEQGFHEIDKFDYSMGRCWFECMESCLEEHRDEVSNKDIREGEFHHTNADEEVDGDDNQETFSEYLARIYPDVSFKSRLLYETNFNYHKYRDSKYRDLMT